MFLLNIFKQFKCLTAATESPNWLMFTNGLPAGSGPAAAGLRSGSSAEEAAEASVQYRLY